MAKPVRDQVIVITGASSGIGLATAIEAARRGARVVLAARNARDLDLAVETIRRGGGEATAFVTDVTDRTQVEDLAAGAVAAYGRIDTWVNNAAVSAYAPFREQSVEDVRRVMEVNFIGQVHGAHAALPYLEQTAGALICLGSTLSERGVPLQTIYCASKHALKGWLEGLRVELAMEGSRVRVTLVKPSSMNTPLFNKAKTQLGVMPRPMPPVYQPELTARAILRAAEIRERDVFVGGAGKLFALLQRLSPRVLDVHQRVRGYDSQTSNRPKPAGAPDNLYAPVEDDGGVHGDFGDAHRRSAYQRVAQHEGAFATLAAAGLAMAARSAALEERRTAETLLIAGAAALYGKALLAKTIG